jgi:P27 family predicted phage terminase small subunit
MSRRPKPMITRRPPPTSPRRRLPTPPGNLGAEGTEAWKYVWKLHWIVPARHSRIVERYCRLQDLRALALGQVERDGMMVEGSQGQLRCHPALVEVRALTTECRLIEVELGLTPAAESKAGVPVELPPSLLGAMMDHRRRDDDESDDPRYGLRVIPPS